MDYAATILSRLPMTRRGTGFKNLLAKVNYLPPEQLDVIVDAYEFGSQAHEGQRLGAEEHVIQAAVGLGRRTAAQARVHETIGDVMKTSYTGEFDDTVSQLIATDPELSAYVKELKRRVFSS